MPNDFAATSAQRFPYPLAGAWCLAFLAVVFAYWPGLGGPFLFDDFGVVAALGSYGGVTDWETFKTFVFGGNAGPTGRPLSHLTFLVDATDWPAESWPFKRTNLVIHLLNGVLLGVVTLQILRILDFDQKDARWLAFLSAACWMLHPFLVSTTLYVVQRMTQLAALFVLTGLAGYLWGRTRIADNAPRAYLIMSASLGAGTVLALLSKENGILLPLLAGVIEITILASRRTSFERLNRVWAWLFLVLPTMVVGAYLVRAAVVADFFSVVPPREFSLYERLLTQPRVLAEYLQHWFIPKLYTTGIFQDHYLKSTALLEPVTTLLASIGHAALILLAIARRREWPLFALAVLFFYGGHVLESTVLNLELYFEHRNYLPAAFLFLPFLAAVRARIDRRAFVAVAGAVLLLLGGFTHFAATIWQDYSTMVATSARKLPTSARAQGQYAMDLFNAGRHDEALRVLDEAMDVVPIHRQVLVVMRLNIQCQTGRLDRAHFEAAAATLGTEYYDPRLIRSYASFVDAVVQGQCAAISARDIKTLFEEMLSVPRNDDPSTLGYSHIKYFIGYANVFLRKGEEATAAFRESLASRPGASHAMLMAALLATGGYFEDALDIADLALTQLDDDRQSTIGGLRVSESDIRDFKAVVRADIDAARGADRSRPDP